MSENGDKRSVSTDALETLGCLISPDEGRDAIHLAVENTVAQEKLYPGQDVCVDGSTPLTSGDPPVGIVDPFLKSPVNPGERFWLVVYPRQIKSLRHVWSHPAFSDIPGKPMYTKAASEKWLRTFCETHDCPPYEDVVNAAITNMDSEYLHFDGVDAHGDIPKEFWDHIHAVTGIAPSVRPDYFSCSC